MTKLIRLGLEVPAPFVLEQAAEAELREVIVLGVREDGAHYSNISFTDGPQAIWHLQRAMHAIMMYCDALEKGEAS